MKLNKRELHIEISTSPCENKLLSNKSKFLGVPMSFLINITTDRNLVLINVSLSFLISIGYWTLWKGICRHSNNKIMTTLFVLCHPDNSRSLGLSIAPIFE